MYDSDKSDKKQIPPERSFASSDKVSWWFNNNEKPEDVFLHSHEKYNFKCPDSNCKHEFNGPLNQISRGSGCPYCSNKQLCDKNKKCIICINKTYASHKKMSNC